MTLKVDQGRVTGEYITKLGDDRIIGQAVPIVGLVANSTIGFVVAWDQSSSTTSWSGRYYRDDRSGQEYIQTVWHLVRQSTGGDEPEEVPLWQAFLTNSSTFRKISSAIRQPLKPNLKMHEVIVLGAGVSGLAAAKAALEEGLNPLILEKSGKLGGLWQTGGGKIWEEMRTNLSKWTCMYSDFEWLAGSPDFPRGRLVEDYLKTYAETFGLNQRIQYDAEVKELKPIDDGWQIKLADGKELEALNVVCATGVFAKPFTPQTPGLDVFPGKTIHSASYRNAAEHGGRIAIIGAALSGVEIAAHLADHGKDVLIAFGHPPWIVPRYVKGNNEGIPLDLMLYRRSTASNADDDDHMVRYERTAEYFEKVFGNPGRIHPELEVPTKGIAPYIAISDTFLGHVSSGKIVPMASRLSSIDGSSIVLADGRRAEVDEIIFCTGYESDLSFLSQSVRDAIEYRPDDKLIPFLADRSVYNPAAPGLYFAGLYRGPYFGVMELQSRWIAMMMSGSVPKPLPEDAQAAIDAERSLRNVQPRPQFPHGDYVEFADAFAAAIGSLPNGLGDPDVMEALERGPVVPSQFRLTGPHANFSVAGASVIEAFNRTRK